MNKTLNTCACESLSTYIASHPYNTEDSCIKREPADSDTFDLTNCEEEVTDGCTDGIQDLYYVRISALCISSIIGQFDLHDVFTIRS